MVGGQKALDEKKAKELLAHYGIRVPRSVRVNDEKQAAECAEKLSPPFVLKVLSSHALHKSDLGGVRLGLANANEVSAAVSTMREQWGGDIELVEGFLVEEMVPAGHEIVIGGFVDAQFGPMIMVGLGGVFVEIFADVAFRVAPIDEADALDMLSELQALPILEGARGGLVASKKAIIDALLCVGGIDGILMQRDNSIAELDINPLIVGADSAVAVDARIVLSDQKTAPKVTESVPLPESFDPLFLPKTIAVAGVSSSGKAAGNRFIDNLKVMGYTGDIYPIHPVATELDGVTAYRNFADMPKPIDYAYIAIPRSGVTELLASANGRVKFAQIMTSGFKEDGTGEGSEHALLEAARQGGVRILGPNCLGTFSPRGRITFIASEQLANASGHIGFISQSGGFGVDLVRTGQARGLRFSGVVTIGNSLDLGPNDLLTHFLNDEQTHVIALYLEDIEDGRRFFNLLRSAGGKKPVVLIKGGLTKQGQKAAASHTGSLAGDSRVWQAVAAQTGCLLVDTIEELIEVLKLFQTLSLQRQKPTRRLALFGNGGGASVVAADGFAQQGFSLADFDAGTKQKLAALALPDGASGSNPIDLPANAFNKSEGRIAEDILRALRDDTRTDCIVVHLNLPVLLSYEGRAIVSNIVDACIAHRVASGDQDSRIILILRSDGTAETDAASRLYQERATAAGIPVFDTFNMAGRALSALARYEAFRDRTNQ